LGNRKKQFGRLFFIQRAVSFHPHKGGVKILGTTWFPLVIMSVCYHSVNSKLLKFFFGGQTFSLGKKLIFLWA